MVKLQEETMMPLFSAEEERGGKPPPQVNI